MNSNKNLIEIVQVDGKDMAIERQKENCWVNLTEMAKPFGKSPYHWLRSQDASVYLEALADEINNQMAKSPSAPGKKDNSPLGVDDLIVIRNGGRKGESGTWCTDYRIAMRFAQWLDARFSVKVDTILVRIARGELLVSDSGLFNLGGKQWISCATYCSTFKKSIHSFYGLLGNYPREFTFWDGAWYMSRDLFSMKEVQTRFESRRIEMRAKNDRSQLELPFVELNAGEE